MRLPSIRLLVVLALVAAFIGARALREPPGRPTAPPPGSGRSPAPPIRRAAVRRKGIAPRLLIAGIGLVALATAGLAVSTLLIHRTATVLALPPADNPSATASAAAPSPPRSLNVALAGAPTQPTPFACGDDDGAAGRLAVRNERADVDGDGKVTLNDVLLVFRGAYLASLGLLSPDQAARLDVDRDGAVTFQDARVALLYALEPNDCAASTNR